MTRCSPDVTDAHPFWESPTAEEAERGRKWIGLIRDLHFAEQPAPPPPPPPLLPLSPTLGELRRQAKNDTF